MAGIIFIEFISVLSMVVWGPHFEKHGLDALVYQVYQSHLELMSNKQIHLL